MVACARGEYHFLGHTIKTVASGKWCDTPPQQGEKTGQYVFREVEPMALECHNDFLIDNAAAQRLTWKREGKEIDQLF